jgi:ferredoxin
MANSNDRHTENVPGLWYIDTSCIICGLCGEYTPAVFKASSDGSQNIVHHQPATAEELLAAKESMDDCPTDSIGNDG